MESTIFQRIRLLCEENGISINKLESNCGFANSTIKKWKSTSNPGVDKIKVIARYFGVTADYILGLTDIPTPADELINDNDIISIQRARSKMPSVDRQKMMQMLRIGFDYAFKDDDQ